nr:reverse transcriptase domain-containing protein [Tanacetum cinerariifolium]
NIDSTYGKDAHRCGKKEGSSPERTKAIQAEVQKLVEARIMKEIYYHDWLSNPVMVKKHDRSWRMCVDFTDLNKGCPQDCYPLPEIDWKVESLCGYPFKCFLDAYKATIKYNWQQQTKRRQPSTQDRGEAEMMSDIEETFQTLRKINMKLNPKKCSFGLAEGVFLGYVITPEGIKPCPDKTTAVLQLPSPQTIKEVQSLNGKLASLNRLRRYFQAHPITVITDQPIKQVMSRPDVAGRLQKWSIMLGEHNITNIPRTSIKGQILADFLNEMPSNASQGVSVAKIQEEPWTMFTDSSSYVDGSGAGLILTTPDGIEFTYALRFEFAASNNEAEYEALIVGLRIATQMGVKNIQENVDSKLVANQVLGAQVPRSRNKKADALSKIASTSFAHLSKQVLVEVLETKSIPGKEVTAVIEEEGPTWMTELVNYLKEGILPGDEKEVRKLRLKARQYELIEGILYKRSFLTPWLRCVGPLQAEYVMKEMHEGSCSMHAGPRAVVAKAIRLRYFWPTMHKDAQDMIRKCSDCQIHRPFSEGPGKVKFLTVAMDYFTKWIEAKAVATITGGRVKKFVWENIVCRFVCKTRTFALGDKPHSFFAPEGKPPRRGLNPKPLACGGSGNKIKNKDPSLSNQTKEGRDGSLRSVTGVDHVATSELNANTTPTASDVISYIGDAEIANSSFDGINATLVEKQYVNVPNTGTRNFTDWTRNFIAGPDVIFKAPISDINVVSPTSSSQNGSAKKNGGVQVGNEHVNEIPSSYATKLSLRLRLRLIFENLMLMCQMMPILTFGCLRLRFMRLMIELRIHSTVMAVPNHEGNGYMKESSIEYEWIPPRCSTCLLYGHSPVDCPKGASKRMGKLVLVVDDEKPLKKVHYLGNMNSEDEVEPIDNETASYLASKLMGLDMVRTTC